mmetsp:Transcript_79248/g.232745  ORF Transcript_79248/g.232745 Transcript_79248/m.232745 type:complete len:714 (-) Transcript_79248:47-2188(-)
MWLSTPLALLGLCASILEAGASGQQASDWSWGRLRSQGVPPAARQGHSSVGVGRRIYVIGGCSQDFRCYSDVHIFDTDRLEWRQEATTGEAPEPRSGHTASLVSTDVFVFGGANSEETFGDVHCLDLVKRHWTQISVAAGGGQAPDRRTNHAAAVDAHGRIYVFGGYGADGRFLNDMWILKVSGAALSGVWQDTGAQSVAWVKQVPTGPVPAAREGHTLTLVDRKLVLFGGYASCGKVLNDLHLYDVDAQQWSRLQIGGVSPLPRQAHSAVRHGRDVVVAGGCDIGDAQPHCFNDVWSLSLIDLEWTRRSSDAVMWYAREGHTATFVRGGMFAFGGCQLGSQCYNDMTVLDSFEPCPAMCGGHGECINSEFCRCTAPGFTGHDCMQPLTCQMDCSGHGSCAQNGRCVCDNGWTGANCSLEVPCPGSFAKCSNRGVCLPSGACQCFPGFTGPDCASAASVSCPRSCSGHGRCRPDGRCVCHGGWTGPSCSLQLAMLQVQCPKGCCDHGVCKAGGCHCERGWFGSDCSINQTAWSAATERERSRLRAEATDKRQQAKVSGSLVQVRSLLAAADAAEQRASGELRPGAQEMALLTTAASSCRVAPHVSTQDFGVGAASVSDSPSDGADGSADCQDHCNFRGLCEQSVCYCQPGYYGPACGTEKESEKDTLSLKVVVLISGACLLVSFAILMAMLYVRQSRSRNQEAMMGFNTSGIA